MTITEERDNHQRALIKVIGYLESITSAGDLRATPTLLYLDEQTRVKPDVFWVAPNSRCQLAETGYWTGAPDVVVEILSPMTEALDRSEKFELYQRYRVYEYWMLNPTADFIEVYVLLNKRFVRHGLFQPGESFNCGAFNGHTIDVAELFD